MAGVTLRTGDVAVVFVDDFVVHDDEGGTSIDEAVLLRFLVIVGADVVAVDVDPPKPLSVVDVDPVDLAFVLARVDEAEVVGARPAHLEVGGEDVVPQDVLLDGVLDKVLVEFRPH